MSPNMYTLLKKHTQNQLLVKNKTNRLHYFMNLTTYNGMANN